MPEAVVLHPDDVDASLATAWDALPAARGAQADIYDSHAWFASWLSVVAPDRERVRIAAVTAGGRPLAMLPMLRSRNGRRAEVAGMSGRSRVRPVIGTENAEPEILGLLAEAIAQSGVRDLDLHRMPSADPATEGFVAALRDAGYRVAAHERSTDNLAVVDSDWAGYSKQLGGFAKYARRFTNRLESLWTVKVDTYGTSAERPAVEGFDIFDMLHQRSWKRGFDAAGRRLRTDLLRRAEQRGWVRIYVLRVDEVPVAAHIWFRLGDRATWSSTAYDRKLAVLSPGTVMMWAAQAEIFAEPDVPRVVDLLPGTTPEKDRLTLSAPPLLATEAIRPTVWSGVQVPARRGTHRVVAAVEARRRARRRGAVESAAHSDTLATGVVSPRAGGTASRLELTAAHRRYIAAATGHASPEKMAAGWGESEEWWIAGDGPEALVRVDAAQVPPAAREIIRIDPDTDPSAPVAQIAAGFGREIACPDVPVFDAVLPWPRGWATVGAGGVA